MNKKLLVKQLCPPIIWNLAKLLVRQLCPPAIWGLGKKCKTLINKPYYSCGAIEDYLLAFYPNNRVRFCCMNENVVTDFADLVQVNGDYAQLYKLGVKKINRTKQRFRKGDVYESCLQCPSLIKDTWGKKTNKISSINLSHYTGCNLKCIYCGWVDQKGLKTTDSELVIKCITYLKEHQYLAEQCMVAVGGGYGEPSLSEGIFQITKFCIEKKLFIDIHSNAAKYVELFAQACNQGQGQLVISSDAGSPDIFKKIKLVDWFDKTWENIRLYMENTTQNVIVKYLLQPVNMSDYTDFVHCCVANKVRIVMIDRVVGIECNDAELKKAIACLRKLCGLNNIETIKGGFLPSEYWI